MADSQAQAVTSPKSAVNASSPASPKSAFSPRSVAEAAGGEEVLLEVDYDRADDDATIDEQLSTFTASLSSSAIDYPMEHGRRYHAYQKGSYIFPNDEREQERLDVTHHMIFRTLGGRFWLAPIDEEKVQNVLDIGTGTGLLAIELGDALPGTQIIGCDLSAIQSPWVPPNVKFEIDDVEQEWAYPFKFDYVVSRQMAGSIADWPRLAKLIYENLNPGGWIEFQDFDLEYFSDDGTLTEEHDFRKWNKLCLDGLEAYNRTGCPGRNLRSYAEGAGFINTREEVYKVPMGSWPKDPELKKTGMMNLVQMLDGVEGFSLKSMEAMGWSKNEIEVFLASVRREMKGTQFHSYIPFYVVYGQKPEAA